MNTTDLATPTRPSPRGSCRGTGAERSARAAALGFVAILCMATPAWPAVTQVTYCGQSFLGQGVLAGDLDCSGFTGHAVTIERGRLALNGFTIRAAGYYGVHCETTCRVLGPGTITGNGLDGIHAEQWVIARNLSITGNGLSGIFARSIYDAGRTLVRHLIITNNGLHGIEVDSLALVRDSRISGNGRDGINVGMPACDTGGKLAVSRSTVSNNGTACPESTTCADITACGRNNARPRIRRSVCLTSYVRGSGFPGSDWNVCSQD